MVTQWLTGYVRNHNFAFIKSNKDATASVHNLKTNTDKIDNKLWA